MGYDQNHVGMHYVRYGHSNESSDMSVYYQLLTRKEREANQVRNDELEQYDPDIDLYWDKCTPLKCISNADIAYFYCSKGSKNKKKQVSLYVGYDIGGPCMNYNSRVERGYYLYIMYYKGMRSLKLESATRFSQHGLEMAQTIGKQFGRAVVENYFSFLDVDWGNAYSIEASRVRAGKGFGIDFPTVDQFLFAPITGWGEREARRITKCRIHII